ncbi:MAG: peptidoglycan-binding protein [Synergistaceae bacterium]|nr:peptidoglycan-binding protein [Synergistaceae bacterium]
MDRAKKYLFYAVILLILAGAALFIHEASTLRWYALYPEASVGGAPHDTRAPYSAPGTAFSRPSGKNPMNAADLAWILRERIALGVMERMAAGGAELAAYNERVREYNRVAGAIEYRESDMLAAERLVEGLKGDIVRETDAEIMSVAIPLSVLNDDRASLVWQVQKYLNLLGYYPGEANGKESKGTTSAVKMFELKSGVQVTGRIDERLSAALREFWISRNIPVTVGFDGEGEELVRFGGGETAGF